MGNLLLQKKPGSIHHFGYCPAHYTFEWHRTVKNKEFEPDCTPSTIIADNLEIQIAIRDILLFTKHIIYLIYCSISLYLIIFVYKSDCTLPIDMSQASQRFLFSVFSICHTFHAFTSSQLSFISKFKDYHYSPNQICPQDTDQSFF